MRLGGLSAVTFLVAWGLVLRSSGAADDSQDTLGPWRAGDMAYSPTLADDRPNAQSHLIVAGHYRPLAPEKLFKGDKGKLGFRVAPRNEEWAGILVLDASGKPAANERRKKGAPNITLTNAATGQGDERHTWLQYDTHALFTDASRVFPQTRITVKKGTEVIDEATIDFTQWKLADSTIRMSDLLDGPTHRHGFVTARDGAFWRDGRRMFFWGGHENHIPEKAHADFYAETYAGAGLNVQRHLGFEEMVPDPHTGQIDPRELDKYHYLIAKLGEKGIYFFLSFTPGYLKGMWGMDLAREGKERGAKVKYGYSWWVDPHTRDVWKKAMKAVLSAPNPYNGGKAIKDDPTVIAIELANETGMNERRFDFNQVGDPELTRAWREEFNRFLLKKYGSREALARSWEANPLFPHEDPAKATILIPSNYRGARNPYGGYGQHDQFTIGRWYRNGLPADKNPRILDAIEFNKTVAHKSYPFDFNNLTTPEESEKLRLAFNEFLMTKYGDREALEKAWTEDQLFPWESPGQVFVIDRKTKKKTIDPDSPGKTILIPTNYRGELTYQADLVSRRADPRISDAMEFTYQVQKAWATDLAQFLRKQVGIKCGIGWNGDTFHIMQVANHKANLDSPLDIAIAAAYLDTDNGDQSTSRVKNLKRFTAYGRIFGRPMFAYEWSFWSNQGPYPYEYALLAALMGRTYGFDGFAHHKMSAIMYPVSDPDYSLKVNWIAPLSDRPRRGAFQICQWIMQRSRIEDNDQRILVGIPYHDAFTGGPERRFSNWAFENWIMYQLGIEDYSFQDVYDGPADRIVIHDGRAPYGDYRKAKHAILWSHSNTDRDGKDPQAKQKWFALHGIHFAPGQKYFVNDQFFATTEDLTDFNVVHRQAEAARGKIIAANAAQRRSEGKSAMQAISDDYWAAEPNSSPTDLDRQLYAALKRWNYPLPFTGAEMDKVWRSRDRRMAMDSVRQNFRAERDDLVMWFGKAGPATQLSLGRLQAKTEEKQYAVALLPWDTADFTTARTLCLWCMWNSEVMLKVPHARDAKVYAVNWLGKRIFEVQPQARADDAIRFATARHDDIFCYEVVRP